MFSRRPLIQQNRGRIPIVGGAAAPATPLTVLAAGGAPLIWLRSDLGITIGTGVSAWADQSGNGHDFLQGTAGFQPDLTAGLLNGHPGVVFNGVNISGHWMANTTHVYPAPGTTPMFHWFIATQNSWQAADPLINSVTGFVQEIFAMTATPTNAMYNGSSVNQNAGAVIGSPRRIECFHNNTTSCYLKIGSTSVTGGNSGNTAGGGGSRLCADSAATLRGHWTIFEYVRLARLPSAGELAALDAYVTSRYGAGLV